MIADEDDLDKASAEKSDLKPLDSGEQNPVQEPNQEAPQLVEQSPDTKLVNQSTR